MAVYLSCFKTAKRKEFDLLDLISIELTFYLPAFFACERVRVVALCVYLTADIVPRDATVSTVIRKYGEKRSSR